MLTIYVLRSMSSLLSLDPDQAELAGFCAAEDPFEAACAWAGVQGDLRAFCDRTLGVSKIRHVCLVPREAWDQALKKPFIVALAGVQPTEGGGQPPAGAAGGDLGWKGQTAPPDTPA